MFKRKLKSEEWRVEQSNKGLSHKIPPLFTSFVIEVSTLRSYSCSFNFVPPTTAPASDGLFFLLILTRRRRAPIMIVNVRLIAMCA